MKPMAIVGPGKPRSVLPLHFSNTVLSLQCRLVKYRVGKFHGVVNLARQYVPDSSIIVFGAGAAANIQSTFLNVGGAAEAAAADVGDAFGSGFDRLADGAGTAASALKVALVVAVVVALAYAYKQIKP